MEADRNNLELSRCWTKKTRSTLPSLIDLQRGLVLDPEIIVPSKNQRKQLPPVHPPATDFIPRHTKDLSVVKESIQHLDPYQRYQSTTELKLPNMDLLYQQRKRYQSIWAGLQPQKMKFLGIQADPRYQKTMSHPDIKSEAELHPEKTFQVARRNISTADFCLKMLSKKVIRRTQDPPQHERMKLAGRTESF